MTIAVSTIISKLAYLLLDEDNVRWTNEEVYGWINDAAAAIVDIRPMAGEVTEEIELISGPLQTFDCVEIIDLVRNSSGKAITRTDRFLLDSTVPDWYSNDESNVIIHYTYDERRRKQVYVYPPALAGTKVEVSLAKLPAKITDISESLDMSDDYINAVINYCLFRCYGKDDEVGNATISGSYYKLFEQSLGVKNQTSIAASPNRADP